MDDSSIQESPVPDSSPLESTARPAHGLRDRYLAVRNASRALSAVLTPEDCVMQTMADVSPTKWHLAHTTWFFETFLLQEWVRDYVPDHPEFRYLFNSYYNSIGEQFPRARRGTISRPSLEEVWRYRDAVDERMTALAGRCESADRAEPGNQDEPANTKRIAGLVEVGLNHEQQHQELMLTDIKHVFWSNPLRPAYADEIYDDNDTTNEVRRGEWVEYGAGMVSIGHDGRGFCFDNELPRHDVSLRPFRLASRLATNGEYLAFIEDGGYRRPELWLSDGWDVVRTEQWLSPLYWESRADGWWQFTLSGMRPLRLDEPVCHVSYFEADAFARWSEARLPTEAEWETAAAFVTVPENFAAGRPVHPRPAGAGAASAALEPLLQMYGDVWQWTASPYVGYPGYRPARDALGEYNGKFMCNQFVLRGGSCATPAGHTRRTYRNFFQPEKRWQFTGIRLAQDA